MAGPDQLLTENRRLTRAVGLYAAAFGVLRGALAAVAAGHDQEEGLNRVMDAADSRVETADALLGEIVALDPAKA